MFRLIIKCVMICVLLMAIASYVVYLRTGSFWVPVARVPSISLPSFSSFSRLFSDDSVSVEPVGETVSLKNINVPSYKWQQKGIWHYGDTPPQGINAIRIDGSSVESEKQ